MSVSRIAIAALLLGASACAAVGTYRGAPPTAASQPPCDRFSFFDCGSVGLYEWIRHRADASNVFAWAKKRGTTQAWDHYLALFPKAPDAVAAQRERENAAYAAVMRTDESGAYRAFLGRYPQGHHSADARLRLEKAAFREAEAARNLERWQAYLREFAAAGRAAEVYRRIEAIHRDTAMKTENAREVLRFLALYPHAPDLDTVRARADSLLAQRALALRSPGLARYYLLAFPKGHHVAHATGLAGAAPPPVADATLTELKQLATTVPLLGRLLCFERVAARLAALKDGYGVEAERFRAQLVELIFMAHVSKIEVATPPTWCGVDALPAESPTSLGDALALARTLPGLQKAVRSAFAVSRQLSVSVKELDGLSGEAKDVISKADLFEQRWQALGAPPELQDVQMNASKLGEHVRDGAAAMLVPARVMEQNMKRLFKDTFDAFVGTTLAVALLTKGAP